MNLKYRFQIFIAGMAIFSMFFGGGNLTFPLWIGTETTSIFLSALGFIFSGVLLPFLGIAIILYFKGNYEECFAVFGKTFGKVLAFSLLLFWIPLGSGPRCNQLAYGAFCCQMGETIPIWLYSAFYSGLVFVLTLCKKRFLAVLGKVITPILIFSLFFIIFAIFESRGAVMDGAVNASWQEFYSSFVSGYYTMDFIAAVFFASTIITLMKEKQKNTFDIRFVCSACIFAISLLSIIYIGMISVGKINADILTSVSKDQLLAVIGKTMFSPTFRPVIFVVITLSVLSTSMALMLVFADYLRKTIFKDKIGHKMCLLISVVISYLMSIIGFQKLTAFTSVAMSTLYPILLVVTMSAFMKKFIQKAPKLLEE